MSQKDTTTTEPLMVEVPTDSVSALAENIEFIAQATRGMLERGLKRETIVLLLHKSSRVAMRDVREVLKALETLDTNYLH